MTNNRVSSISKIYAKALMDIAAENNSYDSILNQLQEIKAVLNNSEDLMIVLANSSIATAKKIEIINDVFAGKVDNSVLNFLKLIIEKNRFNEFEFIINSYSEMLDQKANKKKVEIVSAVKLNFEAKTNVLFKLEHKLNCEIVPDWQVDENIIAGLIFKFDDFVIDTSVRNKVENLSKTISR